jgi:hypothetical protein
MVNKYFVLLFLILFNLSGFCDSVEMMNGKSFPVVETLSFEVTENTGTFSMKIASGEKIYPVKAATVKSINFAKGKNVTVELKDGRIFDNARLLEYKNEAGTVVFNVSNVRGFPEDKIFPLKIELVTRIEFISGETQASPALNTEDQIPEESSELPALITENQSPEDSSELPMLVSGETGEAEDYSDEYNYEEYYYKEEDFGKKKSLLSIIAGSLLKVFLQFVFAMIVGGLLIKHLAGKEGGGVPFGKAVLTAFLLAVFPPLLAILVLFIPFLPFKFIPATAVWYFSARAIVMGMLEVLESEASSILGSYVVIIIVFNIVLGKIM